jgi:ribonuclease T2
VYILCICILQVISHTIQVAFFDTVINLYQNLTTYDWLAGAGILPDSSKTWAYDDMVAALGAHYGFKPSLDCQSGAVFQVSYYYSLIGSVIDGIWLPKDARE